MAMNVIGNPITNATLLAMPEYEKKTITRADRARVALKMKNAKGNDYNVSQFVETLGKACGAEVSTLGVIYNATGDTIRFVAFYDWDGFISRSPFPVTIANGQWAGFVHVKFDGNQRSASKAAVVYRGKNDSDEICDYMMAWRNGKDGSNTAYTEIREKDHFEFTLWDHISGLVNDAGFVSTDQYHGCTSTVSTGSGYKAHVEAIFSLESAETDVNDA